jgi:hypothetical protein
MRYRSAMEYVSGRRLALLLVGLVGLRLGLHALDVACYRWPLADAFERESTFAWLDVAPAFAFIACAALFVAWLRRAERNLPALGAAQRAFTPQRAVRMFFMPIDNFYMPLFVMSALWWESQPTADGRAARGGMVPLVTAWWVAFWLARYAAWRAGDGDALACDALASGLFAAVVWKTQRRQEAQWEDLERRRNVPRPSGAGLR